MARNGPKSTKMTSKIENFSTFSNGPKWIKMAFKWSKMAPKRIFGPFGLVLGTFWPVPPSLWGHRRPKEGPKWPQNDPKIENFQTFPNGPKWPPNGLKWPQNAFCHQLGPLCMAFWLVPPSFLGVPGSKRLQNGPKWTTYYRTEARLGGAQAQQTGLKP